MLLVRIEQLILIHDKQMMYPFLQVKKYVYDVNLLSVKPLIQIKNFQLTATILLKDIMFQYILVKQQIIQFQKLQLNMQIPFSFLQKSEKSQIKDLAFLQILKRKGPYIQRSLLKIQNDLIYKHKINGTKITNISFIKQIRQNLSSYQVIINQIKNDFLMTELDSLGEGIKQLFSQMITIIKFFADITLKKQKIHQNQSDSTTLEQLKQKQQQLKKIEQEQIIKQKEKEKENDRSRQIQKLKFNFRQLFKMQTQTQNNHKLYQAIWKSIINQTKISAEKCINIQNSQMNKIIKDSCEFLYKNHSQLDNIIRLSKLQIIQGQKVINGFPDCNLIIDNNHHKINKMKQVAHQLVQQVRQKVYQNKCIGTQTNNTQVNSKKPMMTIRQLQERRKLQESVRHLDQQNLFLRRKVQQLNTDYRKLQQRANRKSFSRGNQQKYDDDEDEDSNTNIQSSNNITINSNKFNNLQTKNKKNNYNSFKINQKSVNKFRQASFTVGKQPFKKRNSQYVNLSKQAQKSSNRSSKTSKDMGKKSNMSTSIIDNKKYLKIRNSVIKTSEINSIKQLSKRSDLSQQKICKQQVQIQQNKTTDFRQNQYADLNQVKKQNENIFIKGLEIIKVFNISYKPKKLRIFYKNSKDLPSQAKISLLQNSNKLSKFKFQKAISEHQQFKYYFQPYKQINQRYLSITKQITTSKNNEANQTKKKRSNSCYCQKDSKNKNMPKEQDKPKCSPELAVTSMMKIKSDRYNKQGGKQNKCLRKGITKSRKQLRFDFQKEKLGLNRPGVTFSDLKQVQQLKENEDQPDQKIKFQKLQV